MKTHATALSSRLSMVDSRGDTERQQVDSCQHRLDSAVQLPAHPAGGGVDETSSRASEFAAVDSVLTRLSTLAMPVDSPVQSVAASHFQVNYQGKRPIAIPMSPGLYADVPLRSKSRRRLDTGRRRLDGVVHPLDSCPPAVAPVRATGDTHSDTRRHPVALTTRSRRLAAHTDHES